MANPSRTYTYPPTPLPPDHILAQILSESSDSTTGQICHCRTDRMNHQRRRLKVPNPWLGRSQTFYRQAQAFLRVRWADLENPPEPVDMETLEQMIVEFTPESQQIVNRSNRLSIFADALSHGAAWREVLTPLEPMQKHEPVVKELEPDHLTAVPERILDLLDEQGLMFATELAQEMSVRGIDLAQELAALSRRGYISGYRDGRSHRWRITEAGRKAAITPNPAVWQK